MYDLTHLLLLNILIPGLGRRLLPKELMPHGYLP